MRYIFLFLIFSSLATLSALAQDDLAKFLKTHAKGLAEKGTYEGNNGWSQLQRLYVKGGQPELLKIAFVSKKGTGNREAEYVMELVKLFKASPDVFMQTSSDYFGQDLDCLMTFIVPRTQWLKAEELKEIISTSKTPTSAVAQNFSKQIDQYLSFIKTGQPFSKNCTKYFR